MTYGQLLVGAAAAILALVSASPATLALWVVALNKFVQRAAATSLLESAGRGSACL